jgi:hypothetical protein
LANFAAIVGFNLADMLNGMHIERLYAFQPAISGSKLPLLDESEINPIRTYNKR